MFRNRPGTGIWPLKAEWTGTCFLVLTLTTWWLLVVSSCAVVRAPTGGPRDTLPPRLLGSIPRNFTREFRGKEIILIFDEYIKIKEQATSVFISPEPDKAPEVRTIQKSIHILFKSPLLPNTTYSVNFGNSIIDYNEGNAYKNFRFVFSTGKRIDSLKIAGHVSDPLDTTSKKDVFVILHRAGDDSAILKKKPLLFTSTDKDGNFEIANVGPGNYALYALDEANKNKKYDAISESIAFLNKPIHLVRDTADVNLYLFKQDDSLLKIMNRKIAGGLLKVTLNKPVDSLDFTLLIPAHSARKALVEKRAGDSVLIWLPSADLDSVKIGIGKAGKELLHFVQHNYVKRKKAKNFTIGDNLVAGLKSPALPFELSVSEPLDSLDINKLTLREDSVQVQPDSIVHDAARVRFYGIYYPWETGHKYSIGIKAAALTGIYKDQNQPYQRSFTSGAERNYGTILLKVSVPRKSSYLVELMTANFKVVNIRRISSSTTLTYKYIEPGIYRFRVVYDKNQNGRYDTGNLQRKIQPEKILNSKEITTRSNFEQNETWPLPDL